jgi:hydroxymethylglutaryl-CoA lyase
VDDEKLLDVVITDVTLREYGQNVPSSSLDIFTPQIRIELALKLIEAGIRNLEVLSCVHPRISPAMDEKTIRTIACGIGRMDHVNFVTLVPNLEGYKTFLSAGLGPGGYNHSLGIFFSAVETHNLLNLGRTIKDTLDDYKSIMRDALQRKIRIAAYISAAFGYRPGPAENVVRPGPEELGAYLDKLLEMGAATITLSDLQGVADERETRSVLESLLKNRNSKVAQRLGYHPHHPCKEKGIANSMAAYETGLRRFDASLGGTGGCVTGAPGNQPTEALVEFFEKRGIGTGIDLEAVIKLSRFVHEALYRQIALNPPLTRG